MWLIKRLQDFIKWRENMDAQVTTLVATVATLKVQVASVTAEVNALKAKIASGVIDPVDEAAITQANADIATANSDIAAVLSPV